MNITKAIAFTVMYLVCSLPLSSLAKETSLDLKNFDSIKVKNESDIIITQGKLYEVKFKEGDPASRDTLIEVRNNTLHIERKNDASYRDAKGIHTIHITLPKLKSLHMMGSGDVTLNNISGKALALSVLGSSDVFASDITALEFNIEIKGSGDISIGKLKSKTFKADIKGSGDIDVSGRTDKMQLSIFGSGDFDGADLRSETATISVFGSGDVTLKSANKLKKDIKGSGDVSIIE